MADDGAAEPAAVPASGHWLQAEPPNFRYQVLNTIVRELSKGVEESPQPQLLVVAAQFENKVLKESSSKQEYLSTITRKMGILKLHLQRHQLTMGGGQMQQGNGGQTIQPGAGDSRAAATAATPRPASQPQIDMHAGVKQPMAQLQMQAGNFAARTGVRPNAQLNHPLWQNAGGMGTQQRHPHQQPVMRNQQVLRVNQHQSQGYHGSPRAPATMGSAGEVDWREDFFQKITWLKDSHFSELAEFDRAVVVQTKTKEQLESASKEEAQRYMARARLKEEIRNALRFLQLQKGDLHEGHREHFGKCHKIVLDLVQMHKGTREKSLIAARNAAARSSSQSQSYGAPPPVAYPAGGGGMVLYTGGTNSQQIQHEQSAVVQTVSSPPPAQNIEAGAPPSALQQSHGDNLQHEQPAVQTVSCPLLAQSVEAGAPPAALQQSHGYQLVVGQTEDGVAVSGSAEAQAEIVGLTGSGDSTPSTGGKCSRQEQQEPLPADDRIPPGSRTQHVSSGTPPPAQQQNQSGDEVEVGKAQAAGDEVRGGAEGPAPAAQEETTASKLSRGIQAMRSLSPAALADDMGVNLKRAFRHEPEWPWDSSVDKWERRRSSSGGGNGNYKRRRTTHYSGSVLDDEIRAASAMLVDTAIVAGSRAEDGSTEIELLYSPVSLTPELKIAVNAPGISARLLVPRDYPRSSPVVVLGNNNDEDDATRKKKGVPAEVDVAFRRALDELPEPRSVEGMAITWDACARTAVVEFAHRLGGGTFSSWYGRWEDV